MPLGVEKVSDSKEVCEDLGSPVDRLLISVHESSECFGAKETRTLQPALTKINCVKVMRLIRRRSRREQRQQFVWARLCRLVSGGTGERWRVCSFSVTREEARGAGHEQVCFDRRRPIVPRELRSQNLRVEVLAVLQSLDLAGEQPLRCLAHRRLAGPVGGKDERERCAEIEKNRVADPAKCRDTKRSQADTVGHVASSLSRTADTPMASSSSHKALASLSISGHCSSSPGLIFALGSPTTVISAMRRHGTSA